MDFRDHGLLNVAGAHLGHAVGKSSRRKSSLAYRSAYHW